MGNQYNEVLFPDLYTSEGRRVAGRNVVSSACLAETATDTKTYFIIFSLIDFIF